MKFIQFPRLVEGVIFRESTRDANERIIVFAGAEPFFLSRLHYDRLVPLLDGEHSMGQIADSLKDEISATTIIATVQTMAAQAAVIDASVTAGASPGKVAVQTAGPEQAGGMIAAIEAAGMGIAGAGEQPDLLVIVTDHYLREEVTELFNQQLVPMLLVRPHGLETWIGPMFVKGQTACPQCLTHRLRFNRRAEHYAASESGELPIPRTALTQLSAGGREWVFATAAACAAEWLASGESVAAGALLSLDLQQLRSTRHVVVRRPQCPACGDPAPDPQPFPDLQPRARRTPTLAERDAGATRLLAQYGHHVSRITGLLPEFINQSRSPGLQVFAGGSYSTRLPADRRELSHTIRFRASGKGLTEATAKASALAETLEWYTLSAQEEHSLRQDSFSNLQATRRVIPPPELAYYSEAQFADREAINASHAQTKYHVPQRFDPDARIGWREVWSLTRNEAVFVPATAACTSFRNDFMFSRSHGSGAGATIEDAITHAAIEAIERDSVGLWWYNYARRPEVAIEGVDPSLLAAMRHHYARIGYRFWLLDITTDLGLPAMVAVSVGEDQTTGSPVLGFGADFDPLVAATRALTELNQLHPHLAGVVERHDRELGDKDGATPLPPHVFPCPNAPERSLGDWPKTEVNDGKDCISALVTRFSASGLEMLVADLTLPDIGLPVAKVVVPGLRGAYPEFGSGRLHDVPLEMGWIREPVAERRMREIPCPC